jgi:putative flippase GtrA
VIRIVTRYRRPLIFALVGVINTCCDFSVFFCLVKLFKVGLLPANCISFSCAVCVSYVLNRNLTFADHTMCQKNTLANLSVYVLVAVLSLGASSYVLLYISSYGSILAGKLAGTMVSFAVNYIGTKTLVFMGTN